MWFYNGFGVEEIPEDAFGFVYKITNLSNDRQYFGKKLFTKAGYKQVKGKRKKITKELQADVEKQGEKQFKREILRFCKSRGECNYFESKYILESDAILNDKYYNDWLAVKVSRSHLKNVKIA